MELACREKNTKNIHLYLMSLSSVFAEICTRICRKIKKHKFSLFQKQVKKFDLRSLFVEKNGLKLCILSRN